VKIILRGAGQSFYVKKNLGLFTGIGGVVDGTPVNEGFFE
jgi:hypothetical protein